MFGHVQETPQTERTPFYPRSPYGVAKVYGHWITVNYRESYDMYAVSGILFNHESPRRADSNSLRGRSPTVSRVSSTDSTRSSGWATSTPSAIWGFAGDYVQAMWLMLQQRRAGRLRYLQQRDQYRARSMRGVLRAGRARLGRVRPKWTNDSTRPAEVQLLLGDSNKAREKLGWTPEVDFKGLMELMVDADLALVEKQIKNA